MKRILKVLAATALMVVLVATTVSPAFAARDTCKTFGYGCQSGGGQGYKYTGHGGHVYGWACGSPNNDGYNDVCEKR